MFPPPPITNTLPIKIDLKDNNNSLLPYAAVGLGGNPLPPTYVPPNLVHVKDIPGVIESKDILLNQNAADALAKFAKYAQSQGYTLYIADGYRSYDEQAQLHNENPTGSATPGNSEHQTGLAMDIYYVNASGEIKVLPGRIIAKAPDFGIIHPVADDPPHFFVIDGLGIDTSNFNVVARTENDYILLNEAIINAQNEANK
ncbi:MAG TPA: D-alanyl-D-alanine carboxypeptidase family protein [Patescibacteria group bacterium]|nr:D-alanyl-D-alanine carboxypeptidase family protein [Patescibacteria group bacterium]